MLGEGEWKTKKHGAEYRRQWRKVHLGIDAQTLEIRAIEVTDNSVGDAPMLPELLSQIPLEERIATVSGDGAYDTKGCQAASRSGNSHPAERQAVEGKPSGSACPERDSACNAPSGPDDLEKMEWLPSTQPGGNQDALRQVVGRTGLGKGL